MTSLRPSQAGQHLGEIWMNRHLEALYTLRVFNTQPELERALISNLADLSPAELTSVLSQSEAMLGASSCQMLLERLKPEILEPPPTDRWPTIMHWLAGCPKTDAVRGLKTGLLRLVRSHGTALLGLFRTPGIDVSDPLQSPGIEVSETRQRLSRLSDVLKPFISPEELSSIVAAAEPAERLSQDARPAESQDVRPAKRLSRGQVVAAMRTARARVQECFDKYRVPGMAHVTLTIGADGQVKAAEIHGIFAGTASGACVQAAVRATTFPRFEGPPRTFDYPFILR